MKSNKVIIFDFDGTIADSSFKIYEILNNLAPDFGIDRVEASEIEKLRDYSFGDILKKFNVPLYKIPFIYLRFKEDFYKIIKDIKPVKDIIGILDEFDKKKYVMHIVSSNTEKSIRIFLKQNKMEKYFKHVKGSLLGKDKAITEIIKLENYSPKDIFYVGDEIRDIEAAKKAGVVSVAVTWGFNTKKALEEYEPDYLISEPEELLLI